MDECDTLMAQNNNKIDLITTIPISNKTVALDTEGLSIVCNECVIEFTIEDVKTLQRILNFYASELYIRGLLNNPTIKNTGGAGII